MADDLLDIDKYLADFSQPATDVVPQIDVDSYLAQFQPQADEPWSIFKEARGVENAGLHGFGSGLEFFHNLLPVEGIPQDELENYPLPVPVRLQMPSIFGLSEYMGWKDRTDQPQVDDQFEAIMSDSGVLTEDKPQTEAGHLIGNVAEQVYNPANYLFGPQVAAITSILGGGGGYVGEKVLPFGPETNKAAGTIAGLIGPGAINKLYTSGKALLGPLFSEGAAKAGVGSIIRQAAGADLPSVKMALGETAPASEFGVKTIGEITGNRGLSRLEDTVKTGNIAETLTEAGAQRAAARGEALEGMFSPDLNSYKIADNLGSEAKKILDSRKVIEGKLWKQLPDEESLILDDLIPKAQAVTTEMFGSTGPVPGEVKNIIAKMTDAIGEEGKVPDFKSVKALSSYISDVVVNSTDWKVVRAARGLQEALFATVEENAKAGILPTNVVSIWREAKAATAETHKLLEASRSLKTASGIAPHLQEPGDLTALREILNSPQKLAAWIRAGDAAGRDLRPLAKDAVLRSIAFNEAGLANTQQSWAKSAGGLQKQLEMLLSPEERAGLQNILADYASQTDVTRKAFAPSGKQAITSQREAQRELLKAKGLADPNRLTGTGAGVSGAVLGSGIGTTIGHLTGVPFLGTIGTALGGVGGAMTRNAVLPAIERAGDRFDNILYNALTRPEAALEAINTKPGADILKTLASQSGQGLKLVGGRKGGSGISRLTSPDTSQPQQTAVSSYSPDLFAPSIKQKEDNKKDAKMGDAKKVIEAPELVSAERFSPEVSTKSFDGVPIDATLDAIRQIESGGGKYLKSPKGALGPYQFMPRTAKAYGLDDPMDETKSRAAASQMIGDLYKQFKDLDLALVAYNWGSGNLSDLIKEAKTRDFEKLAPLLPYEARNYVRRFHAVLPTFLDTAVA